MLLNPAGGDPLEQVSKPVVELPNVAPTPALGVAGALGAIYCISLGAELVKAEEPQNGERVKNSLKDVIIGFVLILVLIVVLKIGMDAMSNWTNSAMSNTTSQFADNGKMVLRLIRRNTIRAGQDT